VPTIVEGNRQSCELASDLTGKAFRLADNGWPVDQLIDSPTSQVEAANDRAFELHAPKSRRQAL
jgi:hypothetical protein